MTDQLQLRHWQQIKQAQALEYAGTPEGNAALVESRRYGLAADRIEELAAQVDVLRYALEHYAHGGSVFRQVAVTALESTKPDPKFCASST